MKKLDDAFNISETEVVETEKVGITPEQKPDRITKDDITRDYEYTRGNLYSIIEKGQEAIDEIELFVRPAYSSQTVPEDF